MKRLLLIILTILVAGLLAGCGADNEPVDNDNTAPPAPITPPAEPPTEEPADGYPAPPPPSEGYPVANRLWIIHPAGEQCAESLIFENLDQAVASLEETGIIVFEAEEVGLMVCEACGCPTSQHFRVQIDATALTQATDLGWQEE